MTDSNDPWYRIGYALEVARQRLPAPAEERRPTSLSKVKSPIRDAVLEQLVTRGSDVLAGRLLGLVPTRNEPGKARLIRAAFAGASAALLVSLARTALRPSKDGEPPPDPVTEMLAGAGRGILYGSVLEPRLAGGAITRGATFGVLEYAASPWGGLDGVLGAASPHRTIPMLGALLGSEAIEAETLTENLLFGTLVGLVYGVANASNGRIDVE